jgi:hypothetical protein
MNERVRQVLTDLERARENLQALSDEICREDTRSPLFSLDHIATIDDWQKQLRAISDGVVMIQKENEEHIREPELKPTSHAKGKTERQKIDMDRTVPHTLEEDFTFTDPYGFTLQGKEHVDIQHWTEVFKLFCQQLAEIDLARFRRLPENHDYLPHSGKRVFATDSATLRQGKMEIIDGIYAEKNYSVEEFCNLMKRLLNTFGIDQNEMVIYLSARSESVSEDS